MRRLLVACFSVMALGGFAAVAQAVNAHFVGEPTCVDIGTQVSCSGKIAGLGEGPVRLEVDAIGIAEVVCVNPAGNRAPGQDTETVSAGSFDLGKPRGGQITFRDRITLAPADPDPAEVCPNRKWDAQIVDVDFTTATLSVFRGDELVLQDTIDVQ